MTSICAATLIKKISDFLTASFYRCENLLTCCPGPQINFISGVWLNFLIYFRYAHARFSCTRSAPLEKAIWLAAATGTARPPIFRFWSASPHERQVKMYNPVFLMICGVPQAFSRDLRSATNVCGAKDKISFHVNFKKIITFKGTIRKILDVLAEHIECLRYPPICLFETLFVSMSL
jgi:hypothetical protein